MVKEKKEKLVIETGKSYTDGKTVREVDKVTETSVTFTVIKGAGGATHGAGRYGYKGQTGTVSIGSFQKFAQRSA